MDSLSKYHKADKTKAYPSPPHSPPQAKVHVSQARSHSEEDKPYSTRTTPSSSLPTPPTSPPRNSSNATLEDEGQAETALDASTLTTLLGLEGWKCGCPTLKKTPCTRQIAEAKKDTIDTQVQSMTSLTQSSPTLEAELDKLVMLVHCYLHNRGYPKEDRIGDWTNVFPIGEGKPVVQQIRKVLGRVSTKCIGVTVKKKRCEKKIGGQKVQHCARTIDEIVKPEVYLDDAYLDGLLKVLETNMYCSIHIRKQGLKEVASWKSSIVLIRKAAGLELVQGIAAPEGIGGEPQGSGKLPTEESGGPAPITRRLPTPDFDRDLDKFWPEAYDTTAFDITERSEGLTDYKISYALIKGELTRPLDPRPTNSEVKEGYVYVFQAEGNKGFVKIGYTARSVTLRHEEWKFDCNRDTKLLYPSPLVSAALVPNAHRVEKLCHAELDHRRIRIYCKACLKQHIEWFEISPAEAIAVVEKWSKWMATMPYESEKKGWTLKEEEKPRVDDIDSFMRGISVATTKATAA